MSEDLPKFSVPAHFVSPDQVHSLVDFYRQRNILNEIVDRLEHQTVFWLMVSLLDDPDSGVVALNFTSEEGSYHLTSMLLSVVDPVTGAVSEMVAGNESMDWDNEGVGKELADFYYALSSDDTNEFCRCMANFNAPMTQGNKWNVAGHLFGEKVASQMEQHYLAKTTAPAPGPSKSVGPRL